jgi:hypothetical protein|tara:strand:- start:2450 stop:3451 length:1002 start_codon:yes stop_codon:yes gene_type:complete
MASLAEIRAKLLEQETRSSGTKSNTKSDNTVFPHWSIPDNTSASLRFLPDGDTNNPFFWLKREMIRLEFAGVKGGDESRPVTIQVPCIEMYDDETTTCPIHAELRQWFKDPSLEDVARKYWKKKSYLFQGFVTESDLVEEAPTNPIRRFMISPQIFKVISAALMDVDFTSLPTDYNEGTDFRVVKGQNGKWADYSTSNWARRERSLNQDELDAVEANGLFNLSDFLPKKPDQAHLDAMVEMFEASVDGQLYDNEKWGNYYRPWGVDAPSKPMASVVQSAPVVEKEITSDDIPFKADPVPVAAAPVAAAPTGSEDAKPTAQDILAAIRNRKAEA